MSYTYQTWVLQADAVESFCSHDGKALCHTHTTAWLVRRHLLKTGNHMLKILKKFYKLSFKKSKKKELA